MPRRRKQLQQFRGYQLVISKWEIGFSSSQVEENPHEECLDLALDVELFIPIKGVTAGHLVLYGSTDGAGGYLKYDNDKTLNGALWIGFSGTATLLTILVVGRQIILVLYGKPFRY